MRRLLRICARTGGIAAALFMAALALPANVNAQSAVQAQTGTVVPTFVKSLNFSTPALSAQEKARLEAFQARSPLPGPELTQAGASAAPKAGSQTSVRSSNARIPGTLRLFNSTTPNPVIPAGFKSNINEPSGAKAGKVHFITGNWYAAFSNNSGVNWTHLSPFTAFPSADGGFCCDQVAIYDEGRDMMIWLLQYIKSGSTAADRGRFRIALKRNTLFGIDGTGWIFYDFLPSGLGGPASGEWFDYPHLALSNDFLYVAINVFTTTTDSWTRTVMARLPLDAMLAGSGFSFNYLSTNAVFNFTPVQGSKDVMYWASHVSTNTERIFRWPESTGVVSSFDQNIPAWSLTNRGSSSCPTGDGQNWCLRTDQRILAGVLSWNHLTTQAELTWFWNVRQGGAFPRPYVNAAKFRESDLAFLGSPLIWHPDGVWHYVAGAANARGDTGLHIGYGFGPNFFPSTAACVDDDFNGVPPGWECVGTRAGTAGPANNGWGDYFAVRPASPSNNGWFATGFTQQGGKFGANVEPRAMVFGRDRDFQQFYRWFTK